MVFSGIPFLYYFLPIFLIVYFVVPSRARNLVLLLASLFFYGWGEPRFVPVLLFSIVQGFLFGLLIEKEKHAKLFMILSIVLSLGILSVCKYANFFVENFNAATGLSIALLNITLPIGISFYTFQVISYVVDVYRKKVPAQKSFLKLAMYIAMFPQLIAGPIVRYADIEGELTERALSTQEITEGIKRFLIGLSKKVLLANSLGELCVACKELGNKSIALMWIYAIAFALQIYFDFSGYSDMAIGLGKILGFHFPENFQYPFIAKSATEFWRRWHISLGSWFRDYVYIPLGGNRVSKKRWFFNIMVVWMLTGFWHGASWNFILWGLFFGLLLILEKQYLLKPLEKAKVWNHVYMFFVIVISFLIFDAVKIQDGIEHLGMMFGLRGLPLVTGDGNYLIKKYLLLLILAVLGSTPFAKWMTDMACMKMREKKATEMIWKGIEVVLCLSGLLLVTAYLVDSSFNPFLYFRF